MSKYNLTGFGEIDTDSLNSDYEGETTLNGKTVTMDLNFDNDTIEQSKLDSVKKFITEISYYNSIATVAMNDDFKSEGSVKDYADHHSEELGENFSDPEKALSSLHLRRIGFYPENEDGIAVFDYTIGQDLTDYLVVVSFREDGKVNSIDMES
jgi:hypothetical protein